MKKNKILTSLLAILLVLVSAFALVACTDNVDSDKNAENSNNEQSQVDNNHNDSQPMEDLFPAEAVKTAIQLDSKIDALANLIAKDLEPVYKNSEAINTLIRAGYQFEDSFIASYKANVTANYEDLSKDVKALSGAVGVYIALGEPVPSQLVTMINQDRSVGFGTFTYSPILVELIEMGMYSYDTSRREAFENTLLEQWGKHPEFITYGIDDQASDYIRIFADKYNSNGRAKSMVDTSLSYIKSVLKGDNADNNIVSTAYILSACVEMDYCGIEHGIDEQSVYDWLSTKILDDGTFAGTFMEPIETLKAMVSYQRFHKIDSSTISRVK